MLLLRLILIALASVLCIAQAESAAFVPCSAAEGTSLQGLVIGTTVTQVGNETCAWILRYQFQQPSSTRLSSFVIDLATKQLATVNVTGCWAGCVGEPSYDANSTSSMMNSPWRFGFLTDSCSCIDGNYTFEIVMTNVSLTVGAVVVENSQGDSVTCPAISFTECPISTSTNLSGICPLNDPRGQVNLSADNCSPGGKSSGLGGGAIAGIVIGSIAGAIIFGGIAIASLAGITYILWKKARRPEMMNTEATEENSFPLETMPTDNPLYLSPESNPPLPTPI